MNIYISMHTRSNTFRFAVVLIKTLAAKMLSALQVQYEVLFDGPTSHGSVGTRVRFLKEIRNGNKEWF